jgi:GNAT superfamily N-acetyltransferase
VKIRKIQPQDYRNLAVVHFTSLIEEHKELDIEDRMNFFELRRRWLTEEPQGYLAYIFDKIVGFATDSMVYVLPSHFREGIGSQLLRKMKPKELWVADKNKRAILFYKANGYAPTIETRTTDKLGTPVQERKWCYSDTMRSVS